MTKFKQFKENKFWTGKQMAEILSVAPAQISRWAVHGLDSWRTADKLSKILGCKPEDILGMLPNKKEVNYGYAKVSTSNRRYF